MDGIHGATEKMLKMSVSESTKRKLTIELLIEVSFQQTLAALAVLKKRQKPKPNQAGSAFNQRVANDP